MSDLSRREFLAAGAAVGLGLLVQSEGWATEKTGPVFELPPLPYATDALEPLIDKQTMEIHYGKHHATYVKNLNDALKKTPGAWSNWTLEQLLTRLDELPEGLRTAVRNNGGGHYNHMLYWRTMAPKSDKRPAGALAKTLNVQFSSAVELRDKIFEKAMGQFGSGWAWLGKKANGDLVITSTPNQDTPLKDFQPILGVDVWEHAYYLKHQNMRKDYLDAWWQLVNWPEVSRLYEA